MKLNPTLAPTSEAPLSKNRTVKELFSAVLAIIALVTGSLVFSSAVYKRSHKRPAVVTARTVTQAVIATPGLSRRRGAFNKAINMLADGAEANPRLAHYYNHVSKRVRGTAGDGENGSAVAAVKSVNNTYPAPADANAVAAKTDPEVGAQAAYNASIELARNVAGRELEGEPRDSSSTEDVSDGGPGAIQRYTVGDMAFDTNAAVEHWMNYYSATPRGRSTMMIGMGRSHSYLEMARAEFRGAGIPEDLVSLALVESVWNPRAVSPAAAGGIWQFIPSTATDYGLTVKAGNDERSDPLKQTRVAAAYLRDLHTLFGDWALAMAAYNSGEPRVMSAIVKNGRADFWDLCDKQLLPKETRDYVPKILAAIKIAGQAEDYGLTPQTNAGVIAGG